MPMVVWGKVSKANKVIEVPFSVEAGIGCMYFEPFRKWSRDNSVGKW